MSAGDYLSRLAVALPLVVAALTALWYAVKRGWIRPPRVASGDVAVLRLVAALALGPGSRLLVVEFDGRRLLLAASRTGVSLIDSAGR